MIPQFSVIVPAYNSAAFLAKGVESVLSQTCGDLELILVDDGSKDNTLAVCRSFAEKDPRVKVFHQENQGHTGARNTGLKHSQGEYVLFLDSDDWIDPDVLQICSQEIRRNDPDVIVFGLLRYQGDERTVLTGTVDTGHYRVSDVSATLIMSDDGSFAFPKSLSGKVFHREKILEHQLGIPNEVLIGEDGASFIATVLSSDTISVIPDVYYHFEVRQGSVSHSSDPDALRRCQALLGYYQQILDLSDPVIMEQFRRLVVAQLYTALRFVALSDRGGRWLRKEFKAATDDGYVKESIRKARFSRSGKKMRVKHLIVRWGLLWLVKPLATRTSV